LAALNVSYSLGGSAASGVDYQVSQAGLPAPMISFAAGSNSATLTVTPLASAKLAGPQSIVLTLGTGAAYSVGLPGTATISLAGNNVSVASVQMIGGSPAFTWASGAGAIYRVFYKDNLNDPVWLAAGPDITAPGAATKWTDTNNANTAQRFYVLMRAN
jgi:hypothetical protein